MDTPQVRPGPVMSQLLLGNRIQQAIYVAAKLGVADLLADGPLPAEELARGCGVYPGALARLLRALAGFGIFAEDDQGRYDLTPLTALLQRGPRSKRAFALWSGGVSYELFGNLEYSVTTGELAFDHLFGEGFFEYLDHHPEVGSHFDEFMARQTAPLGPVVAAYDFSGVNLVVDVAGSAHPTMRGVLVDRPRVIEGARRVLEAAGVADRCQAICGDVSTEVPCGGDVYLLKSVVHGLSDCEATQLLRDCRDAMTGHGKVLLLEFVIRPGNDPSPGKLMDLLMLVGCHGRERTEEEFQALFASAGLRLTNIIATKYGYSVIEGMTS